jgi:hypothetical protein
LERLIPFVGRAISASGCGFAQLVDGAQAGRRSPDRQIGIRFGF